MTDTSLPGSMRGPEIENLMAERRTFLPPAELVSGANATEALYDEAERDYVAFWERLGRERLSWDTPFEKTLEWEPPFAQWFVGG
jgi:acetyl-CoA synthetase